MNIKVITTFNDKLFEEYAHRFIKTYHWPFELNVYLENSKLWHPLHKYKNLFKQVPECLKFVERNKNKTVDTFKKDGVRFCYKVYAYTHAILNEDVDGLICMDADSVFYNKVDEQWIKKHIHRDDCMMSYLGRGKHYSECGFLYFNLNHKDTKDYAKYMQDMYNTDQIYNLNEYHDSFIWDYVRKRFEDERGTINYNIGDNAAGHVQARSILAEVYDHTKGKRKVEGRSPERKIVNKIPNPFDEFNGA